MARWKKGTSGNPRGRPKGAQNVIKGTLRKRLEARAVELLDSAIEQALAGDSALQRFLLDRLLPEGDAEAEWPQAQDPRFADEVSAVKIVIVDGIKPEESTL